MAISPAPTNTTSSDAAGVVRRPWRSRRRGQGQRQQQSWSPGDVGDMHAKTIPFSVRQHQIAALAARCRRTQRGARFLPAVGRQVRVEYAPMQLDPGLTARSPASPANRRRRWWNPAPSCSTSARRTNSLPSGTFPARGCCQCICRPARRPCSTTWTSRARLLRTRRAQPRSPAAAGPGGFTAVHELADGMAGWRGPRLRPAPMAGPAPWLVDNVDLLPARVEASTWPAGRAVMRCCWPLRALR